MSGIGRWLLIATVAAMFVACGDPTEPVVGEATPEPLQEPADSRCRVAPDDVSERVALEVTAAADLEHGYFVVSEEGDGLAFFAAEVVGDDLADDPPIGVWALVGGADAEVLSVNAVARAYSEWPDGTKREPALTMKIDGAQEVRACSRSRP